MKFLDQLERRFGRFAIPRLMYYVTGLYALGIIISLVNPLFYAQCRSLNMEMISLAQVWRLLTFLICPPSSGILFNLIAIYLYYSLGLTLENIWGTFRFNLYFFLGIFGEILAAGIVYIFFGQTVLLTTFYLNETMFLAFAVTFPEQVFYFFGILPIRAKWFALVIGIQYAWDFIRGSAASRICIALSILNFLIFFLLTRDYSRVDPREIARRKKFRDAVRQSREIHGEEKGRGFFGHGEKKERRGSAEIVKMQPRDRQTPLHRCAICGRTELDDPNLEFRYCSKCAGSREYCMDHLYTHRHVTEEDLRNGRG